MKYSFVMLLDPIPRMQHVWIVAILHPNTPFCNWNCRYRQPFSTIYTAANNNNGASSLLPPPPIKMTTTGASIFTTVVQVKKSLEAGAFVMMEVLE